MKKLLLGLIVLVLVGSDLYSQKRVKLGGINLKGDKKAYYEGKLFNGIYYMDYINGQLSWESNYKDGKSDGLYKEWYKSGQKKSEGTAKSDKKNGKWTWWHENGQIHAQGNYKDDELVSTSIYNPVSPID